MTSSPQRAGFLTANPHALATILDASQTKSIIASRDIFDVSGIKLWARDQPVSQALQRKLLDRQLRQPLEACLIAENGVNSRGLLMAVEKLLEQDTPLKPLLSAHADDIVHAAVHLPLHPVAQLLLTAGQVSRPESFDHAVQAMAVWAHSPSPMAAARATCASPCCAACCTTWARCTSTRASARPMPTARWTFAATSSWWCIRTWASS